MESTYLAEKAASFSFNNELLSTNKTDHNLLKAMRGL